MSAQHTPGPWLAAELTRRPLGLSQYGADDHISGADCVDWVMQTVLPMTREAIAKAKNGGGK